LERLACWLAPALERDTNATRRREHIRNALAL